MRRLISLVLFALSCAVAAPAAAAAAKVPLDYKAYDSWNAIRNVRVSNDGRWLAYALVPQDGDPVLIVRDLTNGKETREARGLVPTFTPDSKFVVYTIRALNADIHKAEREHKKADEQPKNGLGILDLTTLKAVTYERVKNVAVPKDPGNDTIAFLAEKARRRRNPPLRAEWLRRLRRPRFHRPWRLLRARRRRLPLRPRHRRHRPTICIRSSQARR